MSATLKMMVMTTAVVVTMALTAPSAWAKESMMGVTNATGGLFGGILGSINTRFQRTYLRLIPGPKSGKTVMQQALSQMNSVRSFTYQSDVDVQAKDRAAKVTTAHFTIGGPVEIRQVWQWSGQKQRLTVSGEVSTSDGTYRGAGEAVFADQTTFIQLTEVPELPGLPLKEYQNQWLMFKDVSVLGSKMPESTGMTPDSTAMKADSPSPEQLLALQQAMRELAAAAQYSPATREKFEGETVFSFSVTLPDEAVLAYLKQVDTIMSKVNDEEASQADAEVSRAEAEKMLAELDVLVLNWRVGVRDFYPRQLATTLVYQPQQLDTADDSAMMDATMMGGSQEVRVSVQINARDYNRPVTVTVPVDAVDGNEVLSKVMGGLLFNQPGMMGKPGDAMIDVDTMPYQIMPYPGSADQGNADQGDQPVTGVPELPTLTPEQQQLLKQYGY